MEAKINMIGIITSKFDEMLIFYCDVLNYKVQLQMENFVEFENQGVRLALSTHEIMAADTGEEGFKEEKKGHSFELAFKVDSPEEVDSSYKKIIEKGAKAIKSPADMPWGQRTAFFADPDNNVHEIFADLAQ